MTDTLPLVTPAQLSLAVRHLRQRRDLSQEELAAAVNRSQAWVSQIERGDRIPSLGDLLKTLTVLGATVGARDCPQPDA